MGVEILKRKICSLCTIVHIATVVAFICVRREVSRRKIANSLASLIRHAFRDWLVWLFIVAIVAAFVTVPRFEQQRNKVPVVTLTPDEIDCIINARVRMFGSQSCAVCRLQLSFFNFRDDEQKERFYIDCSLARNQVACEQMKLTALPTFERFDEIGRPTGRKRNAKVGRLCLQTIVWFVTQREYRA